MAGEDGRFITTASVTRNSPLSNNSELLQLFLFLSFLIPKLSHSLTLHLVTWILWQPLSDVLPYSLSPSTLYALFPVLCHLSAATIPSMLTPSTSFTVILTVMMSLHRSFHLSFTCFLSQAGCQSHAVILNDSLSSHFFFCKFWHPRDKKQQPWTYLTLWKCIFLISGPSNCLWMYMSFMLSLCCLKLLDSLTDWHLFKGEEST